MRSSSYRKNAAFGFLVLFLITFFLLSTPQAFAREAGVPVASFKNREVTMGSSNVKQYSIDDPGLPLGGKKKGCNWLCRLLKLIGTAAQIAIDVLVLVCKYDPKYCVL